MLQLYKLSGYNTLLSGKVPFPQSDNKKFQKPYDTYEGKKRNYDSELHATIIISCYKWKP